ncbi:RAI1 like PD-XK nuclease-domain-containing protein [Cerioporus squamosus]|nr:RAI1 like PD-XK nuclease-domain-containing protein [Cerioporus squamosus]
MSARQATRSFATHNGPTPSQSGRPPTLSVTPNNTCIPYPSTCRFNRPTRSLYQPPTSFLQTFSYTATRALRFTDSALRYYVKSPSDVSLGYGYERWIKRPEEVLKLDPILRSIERVIQKKNVASGPGKGEKWLSRMAVVTRRKIMTKILMAPYQQYSDTVELNVMLAGGTLYLEGHAPDPQLLEGSISAKERKLMYYGSAFEAWSTSSRPGIPEKLNGHPAGWSGDVNTYVQWLAVAEGRLGDHRIVIGGELDCVRGRFNGRPNTLVELKTTASMRRTGDEARFNKKLLKYYIQSSLMGVPEIVVGFRTSAGQLVTTRTYKTAEIPRLVRNKPGA